MSRRQLDERRLAMLIVAALIAVFGLSAAFTDRDPLNPYWITLFTTVLGITVATSAKDGDPDDDAPPRWIDRIRRRHTQTVERQVDHEPERNDRGTHRRSRLRGITAAH